MRMSVLARCLCLTVSTVTFPLPSFAYEIRGLIANHYLDPGVLSKLQTTLVADYDAGIDWEFIRGKEGDWSVGYVPNVENRRGLVKSGTTVLFGFDLGQHDLPELKSLPSKPGP